MQITPTKTLPCFRHLYRELPALAESQPPFMSLFWMLTAPTKFQLVSQAFAGCYCVCTTNKSLHRSLWDAKCVSKISTRLHEPLRALTAFVESLPSVTSPRAANCSYQTFTSIHKPLHGANFCLCEKVTPLKVPLLLGCQVLLAPMSEIMY